MPEDTGLAFASRAPGRMHACGHDAHTAMLASAARVLANRRDELAGDVLFFFQPGEEGFAGARIMLGEGLFDPAEVKRAFALHIDPRIPVGRLVSRPGALLASADSFQIDAHRARRPRLDAARRARPDSRRVRDRDRAVELRDPPDRRVRPGRDQRDQDRRGHDRQRDSRERRAARHDPRHLAARARARPVGPAPDRGGHRERARREGDGHAPAGLSGDGERRRADRVRAAWSPTCSASARSRRCARR